MAETRSITPAPPHVVAILTAVQAARRAASPTAMLDGWDALLELTARSTVEAVGQALARTPDPESATLIQDAIHEVLALAVTERELENER